MGNTEVGIARLRVSRNEVTERRCLEAREAGRRWALERASYDAVERVAGPNDGSYDSLVASLLAAIVNDNTSMTARERCDLAVELFGRWSPSDEEAAAFTSSVCEVLAEVEEV